MLNNLIWTPFCNTPSSTKSFEAVQPPLQRGGRALAGAQSSRHWVYLESIHEAHSHGREITALEVAPHLSALMSP